MISKEEALKMVLSYTEQKLKGGNLFHNKYNKTYTIDELYEIINQPPKLDSDIEEAINFLRILYNDELATKEEKDYFNEKDLSATDVANYFLKIKQHISNQQSKNDELQEEANMYARQVGELKVKIDKYEEVITADEIIEALDEIQLQYTPYSSNKFEYDINTQSFIFINQKNERKTIYNKYKLDFKNIPIELANKITTFFMQQKETK